MDPNKLMALIIIPLVILGYILYILVGHFRAKKKRGKKDPLTEKIEEFERKLKEIKNR